ncbi:MAG: OprO/OprP family phosphate-selective porin [Acidobacteriia bacterium]|nr:OprO/OprP family phosphate-selective porin [Terriglobia bacterium]
MCRFVWWPRHIAKAGLLGLFFVISIALQAQDDGDGIKAVPVLTGSTAYFTRVTAGQYQDAPSVSPLLLLPLGDKWLINAKGSYSDTFSKNAQGDYNGSISYGLGYAQIDYIANRFVTLTAGRFITPFNIYGERFAPNWIRSLQAGPLTSPVTSGSSLGGMVRGGIPASEAINVNYAVYFSSNNTHHLLATDRSTGARLGFFLPRQRVELGASFQQVLQADRPHSSGFYFVWQPNRVPLSVRSEYVRSSGTKGSGYWVESVYRLSQIPSLRRLELAARGQQFFAAENLSAATIKKLGALGKDTNQVDGGLNYYLRSDIRASASYGRQFVLGKNANLWVVGMTYRFVMPMWPQGGSL